MSHDENFEDSSSYGSLIIAVLVLLFFPLLPMLMGWYTLLR